MTADQPHDRQAPIVLPLPFTGAWYAVNTPARHVPSHGTHAFGQTYAIDFIAVNRQGGSSTVLDWRSLLTAEPLDRFVGFGRPILAPANGEIVAAHDGEPDRPSRRSPGAVITDRLSKRAERDGDLNALVGNHVIIKLDNAEVFVLLAHLRVGSLRVAPGERISVGQPIAVCGNSGNSSQPHLHLQAMTSPNLLAARGVPLVFRDYLTWRHRRAKASYVSIGVPGHRHRVEPRSTPKDDPG